MCFSLHTTGKKYNGNSNQTGKMCFIFISKLKTVKTWFGFRCFIHRMRPQWQVTLPLSSITDLLQQPPKYKDVRALHLLLCLLCHYASLCCETCQLIAVKCAVKRGCHPPTLLVVLREATIIPHFRQEPSLSKLASRHTETGSNIPFTLWKLDF